MSDLWRYFGGRRGRWLGLGLVCMLALVAGGAGWLGMDFGRWQEQWRDFEAFLRVHPWLLFWALVILPGLPVPSSALLFTAGVVWREHPVWACVGCLGALALNMSWTYALAAGPGRNLTERVLRHCGVRLPEFTAGSHLRLILILRLTPGLPLFLQNYVLGWLRPPFRLYLPVSVVCTGFMASGIVLSGAGLADGRLLPTLSGLGLVGAAVGLTQLMRRRLKVRNHPGRPDFPDSD